MGFFGTPQEQAEAAKQIEALRLAWHRYRGPVQWTKPVQIPDEYFGSFK